MPGDKSASNDLDEAVQRYVDRITPPKRKRDALTLIDMMGRISGEKPSMWYGGTIVGFGRYHYKYASGHEGEAGAAGFAARKAAMTVYIPEGTIKYADLLEKLGKHTVGVVCIYMKDLEAVDLAVLEKIVTKSYKTLTAGTFTERAERGRS